MTMPSARARAQTHLGNEQARPGRACKVSRKRPGLRVGCGNSQRRSRSAVQTAGVQESLVLGEREVECVQQRGVDSSSGVSSNGAWTRLRGKPALQPSHAQQRTSPIAGVQEPRGARATQRMLPQQEGRPAVLQSQRHSQPVVLGASVQAIWMPTVILISTSKAIRHKGLWQELKPLQATRQLPKESSAKVRRPDAKACIEFAHSW